MDLSKRLDLVLSRDISKHIIQKPKKKKITNLGFCELKTHLRPFAEFQIIYVSHNPCQELDGVSNNTLHYVPIVHFWSRM